MCTLCDGGEEEGKSSASEVEARGPDGGSEGKKGRGGGGGAGEERGRGEVLGGSEREARKRAAATARPGKYI